MNEPTTPPPPPEPEQPETAAPPASEPAAEGGGQASSPNNLMLVLSYIWILALIPLLVEKDDANVQWHAKHGLVIFGVEILAWVVLTVISFTGILACLGAIAGLFTWLGFVVLRVACIVKAVNGKRLIIPGVSEYADKF